MSFTLYQLVSLEKVSYDRLIRLDQIGQVSYVSQFRLTSFDKLGQAVMSS